MSSRKSETQLSLLEADIVRAQSELLENQSEDKELIHKEEHVTRIFLSQMERMHPKERSLLISNPTFTSEKHL